MKKTSTFMGDTGAVPLSSDRSVQTWIRRNGKKCRMRISKPAGLRLIWLLIICGTLGVTTATGLAAAEPMEVFVVNYPLQYFAERIGGGHVKVSFPAPADVDPAYWVPDINTITAFQQADLILLNGAGYAKWVKKVSLPRSRIVDTSNRYSDQYLTTAGAVTHSHGPAGEHAHEALAFTTWLDFMLAARQAESVAQALGRKLPQQLATFEKNYAALKKDLLALDAAMRRIVGRNPSRPLVVSHPVYDYLARAYGMNIKSVHWEPDQPPTDAQWSELVDMVQSHPARWMIWEGQPMPESVERLKSIQIDSLVFDPCGNRPDRGDFLDVMRQNMEGLEKAYD